MSQEAGEGKVRPEAKLEAEKGDKTILGPKNPGSAVAGGAVGVTMVVICTPVVAVAVLVTVVSCNYSGNDHCNVSGSDCSGLPLDITCAIVVYMDNSVHHVGHLHVHMQESTVNCTVMGRKHNSVVVRIAGSGVRLLEFKYHLPAVGFRQMFSIL